VVELIYLPIDTLRGYLDNHNNNNMRWILHSLHQQELTPLLQHKGGLCNRWQIPWRICMRRCGRNARRCAKSERIYARRCTKSERRYARREGRNSNINRSKYHCLHHHHQFHPGTSTGSS
jgi:hypothetical protein